MKAYCKAAAALAAGLLAVLVAASGAAALDARHSGTVLAVQDDGSIVLGEVGPWRIKAGQTEVTPLTVAVTPATEFSRVRRTEVEGGWWPGEFVRSALPERRVKPGDFVTVTVKREAGRLAAVEVIVMETDLR